MDHLAHATVENINHKRWFKNLNLVVTEYPRHSKIFVEGRGAKKEGREKGIRGVKEL